MDEPYNRLPNESPRSGIGNLTPAVWGIILVAIVLLAIWFMTWH